jgi:myo-inositol-1(or 4)-monophosphatase
MERLRNETELAIRTVSIAQDIADSRAGAERIVSKGGIDIVTDTDVACEDAIRSELVRAFPAYSVIGEERVGTAREGQPYWLVDPICGTRPFASNIPLYCTNVALVEDGEVTVAAIGIGKTGEVLYAERGRGARMRFAGADAPIVAGDSSDTVWIDGNTEQAANTLKNIVLLKRWYVWKFSSSVAYAYMALGRLAAVLQFSFGKTAGAPYGSVHSAAGCFIAREAGAIVTDLDDGSQWKLATRSFLMASTVELHKDLSRAVSGIGELPPQSRR